MNNLAKYFSGSTHISIEYIYIKGSPHKAVKLLSPADKLSIRTSLNINSTFRENNVVPRSRAGTETAY